MYEKKDCKIVQDILPNYIENLTNDETNKYIEEHLKVCDECQKVLQNMKKELQINNEKSNQREIKYIKKFNSKLKILKILIIIILVSALAVMTYGYFYIKDAYITAATSLYNMVKEGMYPDAFYATIEGISDSGVYGLKTIKIKGLDINDINHIGDFSFYVPLDNIGDNFKIMWNETNISFEQLKVGQTIAVYNYGNISESEPAYLSEVRKIVVLDKKL